MTQFRAFRRLAPALIGVAAAFSLALLPGPEARAENAAPNTTNSNQAKNLARLNCGAHIDRILPGGQIVPVAVAADDNENPAALVLDDNTLSCPLPVGDNTFIITLPHAAVVERFAFINQANAAHGQFELAVSNYRLGSQDPKWISVQPSTSFSNQRLINLPVTGVEAKYVRLTFHVQKEGRLAGIALYGSRTLDSFAARNVLRAQTAYTLGTTMPINADRAEDTLSFNFANRYAKGRVAYVSSGDNDTSIRTIDDDVNTSFSFAPGDEHPTLIVELAERQMLHRVSTVYDQDEGQVDIYLLNELPARAGDLRNFKPVASIVDDKGVGKAAANFPPTYARYIVLRWSHARPSHRPFGVSEVAGFSAVPVTLIDLERAPALVSLPGESTPDFSNTLGTLANPPTRPVSP